MPPPTPKDLLVIAADSHMQGAIQVLLNHRQSALAISINSFDVQRHPNSDPGCRTDSGAILNPLRGAYRKAVVVFDFHGCGENSLIPTELEDKLEHHFLEEGWELDTVAFVIVEPELEAWVFGASFQQLETVVE